jgi:hypothetical protein
MSDGRQPLHMSAEESPEHFGLGLAQLRKVGGDVRDRAMMLADLHASARPLRRRRVSVGAQDLCQFSRPPISWRVCQCGGIPLLDKLDPLACEARDRSVAVGVLQVVESSDRDAVVRVPERRATDVGQREQPGWTPTAA